MLTMYPDVRREVVRLLAEIERRVARSVQPVDATPEGPEAALELIRAHCDRGLRYYTWALERMPSIREQAPHMSQVESARLALAHVLAYVEGAKDERDAMLARDEIVTRYIAAVQDEGWQPPFAPGGS